MISDAFRRARTGRAVAGVVRRPSNARIPCTTRATIAMPTRTSETTSHSRGARWRIVEDNSNGVAVLSPSWTDHRAASAGRSGSSGRVTTRSKVNTPAGSQGVSQSTSSASCSGVRPRGSPERTSLSAGSLNRSRPRDRSTTPEITQAVVAKERSRTSSKSSKTPGPRISSRSGPSWFGTSNGLAAVTRVPPSSVRTGRSTDQPASTKSS